MQPSFLTLPGQTKLAYHLTEGRQPTVMFLGGFKSDMSGSKATALEAYCKEHGQRFIRFDYSGHGQSSGAFIEGTIGGWKRDTLAMFDALAGDQAILIGSSMGAWIALLIARERKNKLRALIGVASAPDFTERLIWQKLDAAQQAGLMEKGVFHAPSCYGEEPYPITRRLIEEARAHLLLDGSIALDVPIRLIHGTKDEDVPWQHSVLLMEKLSSTDIQLQLVKDGNHRMSEPAQLELLCRTAGSFFL